MIFFKSGGNDWYLARFMAITKVAVYSAPSEGANSL